MLRLVRSLKFPYSEGLFETFPLRNGRMERFALHWRRLKASCRALRYPLLADPNDIERAILEISRSEGAENKAVRLIYSKKEIPIFLLQLLPLPKPFTNVELIHLKTKIHPLAGHKISDRHHYEALYEKATAEKAFDAILVSDDDEVLETTRTNIFVISKGTLCTPAADGRILPGIIRNEVIRIAGELGIPCMEKKMPLHDMASADEIFITNSLRGVVPVVEIRGIWMQSSAPMLTPKIAELLSKID